MAGRRKTIGISQETYKELVKVGGYDETMDDIISKCLQAYKREQARTKKE
jgi:predicted CopG family antitoxin